MMGHEAPLHCMARHAVNLRNASGEGHGKQNHCRRIVADGPCIHWPGGRPDHRRLIHEIERIANGIVRVSTSIAQPAVAPGYGGKQRRRMEGSALAGNATQCVRKHVPEAGRKWRPSARADVSARSLRENYAIDDKSPFRTTPGQSRPSTERGPGCGCIGKDHSIRRMMPRHGVSITAAPFLTV